MRHEISRHNVEIPDTIEKALSQKIDKVEQRLKRYHPEAADLEVSLAYHEHLKDQAYECSLNLNAFREHLHARKTAADLRMAIDRSFDALLREMEQYRARINKSLS